MNLNKNTLFFLSSFSLKILVQFLNLYLISLYIQKYDYSEYNYCLIFVNIYLVFSIGLVDGLNIEIPYFSIQNKLKVEKAITSSYSYFIGLFLLTIISSFLAAHYIEVSSLGFIFIVSMCIMSIFEYYLLSIHRGLEAIKVINIANLTFSTVQLITIILIMKYGLKGLYLKMMISQFIYVGYMYYYFKPKFKFQIDIDLLKKISQVGFPVYALHYIYTLGISLDKILIVRFAHKNLLGIYSYGTVVYMFYLIIYKAMSTYFYPQFINYISSYSALELKKVYIRYTKISFLITFSISIILYLISDYIFTYFLHNYIESLPIFKIFTFVGAFLISNFTSYTLVTCFKDKKKTYFYNFITILPIYISPIICCYFFHFDLIKLSYSILISNILMFLISQIYIVHFFKKLNHNSPQKSFISQ